MRMRWATKTYSEREDEEVERLVRPAPKYKPPRHDRRREEIRPERDPDTANDPDIAGDPDMSNNYKDIGGSVQRVFERFAQDKIPAKSRETGKVVYISPETLKERPGEYEQVDPDERDSSEGGSSIQDQAWWKNLSPAQRKGLIEALKGTPPDTSIQELVRGAPPEVVDELRGVLNQDIKTVGDLAKALSEAAKPSTPKRKPKQVQPELPADKEKEEEENVPSPAAPTATPAAKAEPSKAEEDPSPKAEVDVKVPDGKDEALPEEKTEPKEAPEELDDAAEKKVKAWLGQGNHESPEFKKFLADIPTSEEGSEGILVLDPKTKKRAPFESLKLEDQAALISSFESQKPKHRSLGSQRAAFELIRSLPPNAQRLVKSLSDPESDFAQRLQKVSDAGHDLNFVKLEKVFPELKGGLPKDLDAGKLLQAARMAQAYEALPERERLGLPKVVRPEPSLYERREALLLIQDLFPPRVAASLIAKNLHPSDVAQLAAAYAQEKAQPVKNTLEFARAAAQSFELDPEQVKAPKTWKVEGKEVPFESLSPEDKSLALQEHQARVVGLSLAAKDKISTSLSLPSFFSGQPKVPRDLTEPLADLMLRQAGEKAGAKVGAQLFETALRGGSTLNLSNSDARKLLSQLTPGAKKAAVGYLEGSDYNFARSKYLGEGFGKFSERDSFHGIFSGLKNAVSFLRERARVYGDPEAMSASVFKVAVLNRLRNLDSDKFQRVQGMMDVDDAKQYEESLSQWKKEMAKWEARKAAYLKGKDPYRSPPFEEEPPLRPRKPLRYDLVQAKKAKGSVLEAMATKTATKHSFSTCLGASSMAHDLREAVYHGIPTKQNDLGRYPDWAQGHQCDFGEAEMSAILASARGWLTTPVLSASEGMVRDQQLRAALDLAIHESPFNGQVQPGTYNVMLARLAGVAPPGIGETLETIRQASRVSSCPPSKERTPMSLDASNEVRAFAVKAASQNPSLAYDLVLLADKLAAQEDQKDEQEDAVEEEKSEASAKFAQLKSMVVRTAASSPQARAALLPVIQFLKDLG